MLINFQQFMLNSWPQMDQIMRGLDWDNDAYFIDRWIQANWELMVEKQIDAGDITLPPYGYDSNPNSRYTRAGVVADHRIVCKLKKNQEKYAFLGFTSKAGDKLKLEPPFDYVCVVELNSKIINSFYVGEVDFFIEKII